MAISVSLQMGLFCWMVQAVLAVSPSTIGTELSGSRNSSVVAQPPEWMTAPLYHSPRVFAADYDEMKQRMKIYTYPFSDDKRDKFGYSPGQNGLPEGNYASEDYFFRSLQETEMRTEDPDEATVFLLPFSVFKLRMAIGPKAVPDFVREYVMETVQTQWPFWNRSGGADHFYGTCHDIGVTASSETPGLSATAVQVICPASRWDRNYVPTKDFSLPQIWPRYEVEPGGLSAAERNSSKMLAFWSGSPNSKARKALKKAWDDDEEILIGGGNVLKQKPGRGKEYLSFFQSAKYCLHVSGYQVHTARIGDAIYFGCVPVILADQYDLPFSNVLDWREFAVIVVESQIPRLQAILKSIPYERYQKLYSNVEIVRRHFTWNSPPQNYDIFGLTAYHLWLRRFVVRPPLGDTI